MTATRHSRRKLSGADYSLDVRTSFKNRWITRTKKVPTMTHETKATNRPYTHLASSIANSRSQEWNYCRAQTTIA